MRKLVLFSVITLMLLSCTKKNGTDEKETGTAGNPPTNSLPNTDNLLQDSLVTVAKPDLSTWTFNKVVNKKLVFKEGFSFDTELYNLEYLGQINTAGNAPFLIYAGRECDDCDVNTSLYFHSPRTGKLNVSAGANRYAYPGRERDLETDSLIYEARAFYGEVLKGTKGIIWFQQTLIEDNTFQKSVYLARITDDKITGEELKDYDILFKETAALHKKKKNKEINGKEFTSEP